MDIEFLTKEKFDRWIPSFCRLYAKSFPEIVDEETIRQRYISYPVDELLMCVAIDNSEIVGNYSAIPITLCHNSNEFKCAIGLNTMIDPRYSGKGLFTQLAGLLYSKLKEIGYDVLYTFPNSASNRILISKLGLKDIYEIPTLQYEIKEDETFIQVEDDTIKEGLPTTLTINIKDSIYIKKSREFIKWRYQDNPIYKYHYIHIDNSNWAIFKFYYEYANIVELHISSLDSFTQLVSYIVKEAKKNDCKYVTIWEKINTEKHCALEKMGFINKGPVRYFAAKKLNESSLPDIYNYSNWSICMGDDNVY